MHVIQHGAMFSQIAVFPVTSCLGICTLHPSAGLIGFQQAFDRVGTERSLLNLNSVSIYLAFNML